MVKRLKVAVLMGGESSEREVSLMTGQEVIGNLDSNKYEVVPIDVPSELGKLKGIEVAFLALHGKGGEDGVIQGYLETLGIKYTGCGVTASAVGMDKVIFRKVMENGGFLMAKITDKVPCVVKPVNGGSSVGVSVVKNEVDFKRAIDLAKKYDDRIMIEEYIEGVEVSCGVLGNKNSVALPVIEIRPKKEFFDYESKYTEGMSEEICPAGISAELTKKIQELSVQVFETIGGKGYARVDFIIGNSVPYLLEINTLPGLTANSLIPKEAAVAGISYSQLIEKIIELALI
jgi:D-alanine-D-alanine ligase